MPRHLPKLLSLLILQLRGPSWTILLAVRSRLWREKPLARSPSTCKNRPGARRPAEELEASGGKEALSARKPPWGMGRTKASPCPNPVSFPPQHPRFHRLVLPLGLSAWVRVGSRRATPSQTGPATRLESLQAPALLPP